MPVGRSRPPTPANRALKCLKVWPTLGWRGGRRDRPAALKRRRDSVPCCRERPSHHSFFIYYLSVISSPRDGDRLSRGGEKRVGRTMAGGDVHHLPQAKFSFSPVFQSLVLSPPPVTHPPNPTSIISTGNGRRLIGENACTRSDKMPVMTIGAIAVNVRSGPIRDQERSPATP